MKVLFEPTVEFYEKRLHEQNAYIQSVYDRDDIEEGRRLEIIQSAIGVKMNIVNQVISLTKEKLFPSSRFAPGGVKVT